jgi:hypothetical protein
MRAAKSPKQPAKTPAAIDLEAELARISGMNINELRSLWRERERAGASLRLFKGPACPRACLCNPGRTARRPIQGVEEASRQSRCAGRTSAPHKAGFRNRSANMPAPAINCSWSRVASPGRAEPIQASQQSPKRSPGRAGTALASSASGTNRRDRPHLKTPEAAREEDLTAEGKVVRRHIKAGLFTLLALPVFNVLTPLAELRHDWRRLTIKNPDA